MGVLSGYELRRRLALKGEDSLVVSPLLDVDEQVKKDQASIDIRLGFSFALVVPSAYGAIDEFQSASRDQIRANIAAHYETEYVPFGGKLVIHPHQFILASSLEYLRLPADITAQVIGRSTWGRLGLIVATAIGVHPNFAGTLTLELRNLGETPLVMYPGQSIAQIFFHTVETPSEIGDGVGQYSGSVDLLPRHMSSRKTYRRIRHYIESRYVRDVMHRGQAVPRVLSGTSIGDALNEMTIKQFDAVFVVSSQNRLVGVLTDSDLRGHMEADLISRPVEHVMARTPKGIEPNQLISEARELHWKYNTSLLPVVEKGRLIGVVRLRDILGPQGDERPKD
ncbi:dCTP deaminase [Bradyrhizobium sp. HKCCYLRH3099]|uniref:dCTP deaminase n=1 Tax=unclassified Bradyrhizobium TaxID=2631580 RepID=UPI003EB97E66